MERSWPTLAKPTLASVGVLVVWSTLAKTEFGQNGFDCLCVVCLCVLCVCAVCVCVCLCCAGFMVWVSRLGVGFKVLVWSCSVPPDHPSPDRPSQDSPFPGPPKISLFFPISCRKIHSFLPYLGVSWNFGGV